MADFWSERAGDGRLRLCRQLRRQPPARSRASAGDRGQSLLRLSLGAQQAELVVLDLADRQGLAALLAERRFDAVVHCAAHVWVGESVREPARYYANNTANAIGLFDLCVRAEVPAIVFSSTAAVYGEPGTSLLDESLPTAPINPYGASKAMSERILLDIAAATGMRYAILRYFNVAGADADARIGEATPNNAHLVKLACEAALGLRPGMAIHGTDYPTPDGTCIRDYVHVDDLARAHLMALEHLHAGGPSLVANCGYGHGFSVREVLDTVRRITDVRFPITGPAPPRRSRRPGRRQPTPALPPRLDAPHDDLDYIVATAWRWEQALQRHQATAAEG